MRRTILALTSALLLACSAAAGCRLHLEDDRLCLIDEDSGRLIGSQQVAPDCWRSVDRAGFAFDIVLPSADAGRRLFEDFSS